MRRKFWALLMTVMMIATMVPAIAFAEEDSVNVKEETTVEQTQQSETDNQMEENEQTVDATEAAYDKSCEEKQPEEKSGKVNVCVVKAWADYFNQDGIRPASVKIRLYADGKSTGKTLTLTAGTAWTGYFTGLDKYRNGKKVIYTITEDRVPGYTPVITGNQVTGYLVTNTHIPEVTKVSGTKTWNDADNQDGIRPDSIVVKLKGSDGSERCMTVTAEDNWAYTFKLLPKYKCGKEIVYTVSENEVEGYTSEVKGNDIINTHVPEQISISVEKVWDDADNQDGKRPEDITAVLCIGENETDRTVVLSEGNGWKAEFTGLDKYKAGEEIDYTVKETGLSAETAEAYDSVVTGDRTNGFVITNTHEPELTEVSGTKTWDDADNQDGKRPDEITVRLLANGQEIDSKTVTAADEWKYSFSDLPVYKEGAVGEKVVYTITEDLVDGYIPDDNPEDFDITNTHEPEKTAVTVNKVWDDADDQDGIRPEEITVKLYANGEETDKELKLTEENGWTGMFDDLDKYKAGEEIKYTVTEEAIEGYETAIEANEAGGFTVTNSHTPETIAVTGTKTWDDADDQDGMRPDEITVRLLANGQEIDSKTVTAEENWEYSFEDLPKYENHGTPISYTVLENGVEGYQTAIDGYDITNSYTPGKVSVSVVKSWQDDNDKDGIRPDEITVKLYADGEDTGEELELSAADNWTGTFKELDEYNAGEKVEYTVEEVAVDGYKTVITGDADNGYIVTNSHTPDGSVKTGDDMNIMLLGGAALAALLAALAVVFTRRRRNA